MILRVYKTKTNLYFLFYPASNHVGADVGDKAGIHAKDSTGQFYTIAQDEGGFHSGETTGLAFSPDHKHMYVAYQSEGVIYDITRADGRAFGGATLAIQYHGMYNRGNDEFDSRLLRKAMKRAGGEV